ncbi:beta-lactamase/transpeptidase-like protein [Macrophomina phaseolina]|uniref:Beta-lactamase/transpeptidase-like protein n=1 Tax=Macrophomina phaseolina TaxID=35725 RepID=A0ABQ8FZV0_9PEZI|nr:beta-lactamase/transpeptidase-like protein [Macrophomina phaseolina]
MEAADKLLKDAVENGIIAGCACMASDKNGTIQYSSGFGTSSSPQASPPAPMTTRSVFSLISSTKIMTAIAALQLVERGILSLDQDVSPLISELAHQPVLGGPLDNPRHDIPGFATTPAGYLAHLTSSRGDCQARASATVAPWNWVGKLTERATGEPLLEQYMRKNIWMPLGIDSITFWPQEHPDIEARLVGTVQRRPDGGVECRTAVPPKQGVQECFGGQGAYADVEDFLEILCAIAITTSSPTASILIIPTAHIAALKARITAYLDNAISRMSTHDTLCSLLWAAVVSSCQASLRPLRLVARAKEELILRV